MEKIQDIVKNPPIEWDGQIVITTAQLAEAYGATKDNISDNFTRNKDRFTDGKHYILLEGDALRKFKNYSAESGLVSKNARQLYLWTRRGASRHCKILGTDKAWEQFDYLEDNYFDRQNVRQQPQTTMELLELHYKALKEVDSKVNEVDGKVGQIVNRIASLEETMTLDYGQQKMIEEAVNNTVISVLGGKDSNAYKGMGRKVFAECNGDLKRYFKVNARANVPKKRYEDAIRYAEEWKPCTNTVMLIREYNAQQSLDLEGGASHE